MVNRCMRLLALLLVLGLITSACSSEKSAQEYSEDGRKHLEEGDLSKAIAALEETLKRDPGSAEGHRLMGEALARAERWPEAVIQFEAYQALAQEDALAYLLLGQAYARTGDLQAAASTFAEGVRIDPSLLTGHNEEISEVVDDFLQAGQEALRSGDLATATELLAITAPLVPGQGELYLALGRAHQQAGDVVQALAAFASAVSLSPELAVEHAEEIDALAKEGFEMGQAALGAGDLITAARIMETVVILLPEEPEARFVLGNIFNQTNQLAQAIEQYERVLRLEPDGASTLTNLGVVYYKMGDLETAVEKFRAALVIEADDAETHYLLGAAYVQMEQLGQGEAEFKTALALDDQLAPPYIGLGNIFLLQSEIDSALEMAERAIELSPDSPEAYFLLGQVQIQLGDVDAARAALEKVLSLNPSPRWREQVEGMLANIDSE